MMDRIREALKRRPGHVPPVPPVVYEPTARLVYSDLGLPELFAHAAARGGMAAELVHIEGLATAVADYLEQRRTLKVALSASPLLRKVRLAESLEEQGLEIAPEAGDDVALVTGCDAAVGETGSLVFRGGVPVGWHTAAVRIVILEPKILVPDLIDLLAKQPSESTLVSGPTAVQVFVLH